MNLTNKIGNSEHHPKKIREILREKANLILQYQMKNQREHRRELGSTITTVAMNFSLEIENFNLD